MPYDHFGSQTDLRRHLLEGLLMGGKQTQMARKQTSLLVWVLFSLAPAVQPIGVLGRGLELIFGHATKSLPT